jgi:hypothetical protein
MTKTTRKNLVLEATMIRDSALYLLPKTQRAEEEYSFTELKRVLTLIEVHAQNIIKALD